MKSCILMIALVFLAGCGSTGQPPLSSLEKEVYYSRAALMNPQPVTFGERQYERRALEMDLNHDQAQEILVTMPWTHGSSGVTTCEVYQPCEQGYRLLGAVGYTVGAFRVLPPTEQYPIRVCYYARGGGSGGAIVIESYDQNAFVITSTEQIAYAGDWSTEEARSRFEEVFGQK